MPAVRRIDHLERSPSVSSRLYFSGTPSRDNFPPDWRVKLFAYALMLLRPAHSHWHTGPNRPGMQSAVWQCCIAFRPLPLIYAGLAWHLGLLQFRFLAAKLHERMAGPIENYEATSPHQLGLRLAMNLGLRKDHPFGGGLTSTDQQASPMNCRSDVTHMRNGQCDAGRCRRRGCRGRITGVPQQLFRNGSAKGLIPA